MKLKEIKEKLNKMSDAELEQELGYISADRYFSGLCTLKRLDGALYYNGNDDPSKLRTITELKEFYNSEEIDGMDKVFSKDDVYIEICTGF